MFDVVTHIYRAVRVFECLCVVVRVFECRCMRVVVTA